MRLTRCVLLVGAGLAIATTFASAGGTPWWDCVNYEFYDFGGAAYMAVDDWPGEGYVWSLWIYAESNGEPGLQRGGESLLGDEEVCQLSANPDLAVF